MLAYIEDFIEKLKSAKAGIEAKEAENTDPFQTASGLYNV
jgi:hypothetical protein